MIDRFSPEFRRSHLGASQVPAALGVSPYMDPIELWSEYVHDREPVLENDAMRLGHALEGGVAEVAAEMLGMTCHVASTRVHPRHPWLCATPDRVMEDGSLLQVKTTALASMMRRSDIDEAWGEPGTDQVPMHVVTQCLVELAVERADVAANRPANAVGPEVNHVAALIPGRGVQIYSVEWDGTLADVIIEKAQQFWRYVTDRVEPMIDGTPAFSDYLQRRHPTHVQGRWIEADPATDFLVNSYAQAVWHHEQTGKAVALAENLLRQIIRDAEGIKGSGWVVPWRGAKSPDRVDWKAVNEQIAAELPGGRARLSDIITEHSTPQAPTRRFGPATPRRRK